LPPVSFLGVLGVVAVAFAAPFLLGLLPRIRVPAVVLEIVAGIVLGPALLDWIRPDLPIQVLSVIGLAFLLFLAGLEIDVQRLRGRVLRLAGAGFALSALLALGAGTVAGALGLVRSPLLVGIILIATSLGLVIPVLKDAGESGTQFGQLTVAGATVGDFGAVILLSLFFSGQTSSIGTRLVLLGGFVLVSLLAIYALRGAGRVGPVSSLLLRLQDTTAEIRVRGALLLLMVFVALAQVLGLETILGAFLAGAALRLADRDAALTHPNFRLKLEAIGFGFFVPIFFVSSGLQFDLRALLATPATVARVPLFLLALLIVRGLPAVAYRGVLDTRRVIASGLLQATSLPFIVAAAMIGTNLHLLQPANAAGLVAAGLVSVLLFPATALALLGRSGMMAWKEG
jgi:Kef-type K+ transport system membrane component KefB